MPRLLTNCRCARVGRSARRFDHIAAKDISRDNHGHPHPIPTVARADRIPAKPGSMVSCGRGQRCDEPIDPERLEIQRSRRRRECCIPLTPPHRSVRAERTSDKSKARSPFPWSRLNQNDAIQRGVIFYPFLKQPTASKRNTCALHATLDRISISVQCYPNAARWGGSCATVLAVCPLLLKFSEMCREGEARAGKLHERGVRADTIGLGFRSCRPPAWVGLAPSG